MGQELGIVPTIIRDEELSSRGFGGRCGKRDASHSVPKGTGDWFYALVQE